MSEEFMFDPMTGERIAKKDEKAEKFTFDPMTGEKIVKEEEKTEEFTFDPMTGEKIVKKEEKTEEFMFDPMTGERITNSGDGNVSTRKGFSKKGIGIVASIAVVVLILFMGISSGVFLRKSDKILLASVKTLKRADNFLELDSVCSALKKKKYSVAYKYRDDDLKMGVEYSKYGKEKGMKFNAKSEYGSADITMLLTNKDLQLSVPDVGNDIFYYNYKEDKNGYLVDQLEKDNIAFIDNMLAYLYDNGSEEDVRDMLKDSIGVFRGLKFTEASKTVIEVDHKDRSCKGYTTTIGADEAEQFAGVFRTYYRKRMEKLTDGFSNSDELDELEDYVGEFYDDILDEIKDMEDMDITFYIYGGKLVGVYTKSDDIEAKIQINNTRNPLEKVTIFLDDGYDDIEMEWVGETSHGKETYLLRAEGSRVFSLEYDEKAGDVEAEIMDYVTLNGHIEKKAGTITYVVNGKDNGYSNSDLELEVVVSKKPEKIKMEGDRFDIGNASKRALMDLVDYLGDIF